MATAGKSYRELYSGEFPADEPDLPEPSHPLEDEEDQEDPPPEDEEDDPDLDMNQPPAFPVPRDQIMLAILEAGNDDYRRMIRLFMRRRNDNSNWLCFACCSVVPPDQMIVHIDKLHAGQVDSFVSEQDVCLSCVRHLVNNADNHVNCDSHFAGKHHAAVIKRRQTFTFDEGSFKLNSAESTRPGTRFLDPVTNYARTLQSYSERVAGGAKGVKHCRDGYRVNKVEAAANMRAGFLVGSFGRRAGGANKYWILEGFCDWHFRCLIDANQAAYLQISTRKSAKDCPTCRNIGTSGLPPMDHFIPESSVEAAALEWRFMITFTPGLESGETGDVLRDDVKQEEPAPAPEEPDDPEPKPPKGDKTQVSGLRGKVRESSQAKALGNMDVARPARATPTTGVKASTSGL